MPRRERFQVFISSTFVDLQSERQKIIRMLLDMDCIPAGMELFPAANADSWTVIEQELEQSDYYVVIVGGRYGSVDEEGISITQKEYELALRLGVPVLAFLHKDPEALPARFYESSPEIKKKLQNFRELCLKKFCRYWTDENELVLQVSSGLHQIIRKEPRPGYVRGDAVPEDAAPELLRLHKENEKFRQELARRKEVTSPRISDLVQGEDLFELKFDVVQSDGHGFGYQKVNVINFKRSFDKFFGAVAVRMSMGAQEHQFCEDLITYATSCIEKSNPHELREKWLKLQNSSFDRMKVQLEALGLAQEKSGIAEAKKKGSLGQDLSSKFWFLTQDGKAHMLRIMAIRKTDS